MIIAEQLTEDMKTSMKAGDAERTRVLRLLRGALKNEQIKLGHELEEVESLKVLQREAKQRRDSIEAYKNANRIDLADVEAAELVIIQTYLPEEMTETELSGIIEEVIAETGANSPQQLGLVIGAVMKRAGARADGGSVSRLVREKLAG